MKQQQQKQNNNKEQFTTRGKLVVVLASIILLAFTSLASVQLNNLINNNKTAQQKRQESSQKEQEPPDYGSPYGLPKGNNSDLIQIAKLTDVICQTGHIKDIIDAYELAEAVYTYGRKYNHDPLLLLGIVRVQSCFQKDVISKSNCRGYFQINYNVYSDKVTQNFLEDTFQQAHMACYVLQYTRGFAKDNVVKMLNGYNGWWSDSNPYANKVLRYKKQYEEIYKQVLK